ncbi:DNA primase [Clostridium swellfunianum]|uniref:DNA primase n=1 Tax=Clostridium swellfunianum TaxID=1367462 RepID=UPI00202DEF1C|nr:DNA primase [Clostridium swellfunianum]MCM0648813.1 DNA primase [Clostridium swellfunianum]
MNIPDEIIQKIKDSNDIVEIVSEKVKLKRAGRYYTGLCPFHSEKSPSFTVTPERQIYKCFGCGEGGNVITFVMKTKNMDFFEAVKYLGERANIQIETNNANTIRQRDANEKLYKINTEAARFFFSKLRVNKAAMSYFTGRGILERTINSFGLGFAPKSWNELMNYLKSKGYSELDMLNAGLIIKSQKENVKATYYDRFRNRVIFPVFDFRGKVIGFGGRVLDDAKPKYLNSPETPVFKKGTNLYGLNFAIKNLKERMLIIVEGYMDCISLHQFGITNVVASLGTALTPNQAKLLKRYADKIIISYDADLAGQNATLRGLEILRAEGFDIKVLTVPQGKDPDEFIKSNGREAFLKLVNEALPLIDYRIKKVRDVIDFSRPEMKAEYAKNAALIVSDLNPLQKDVYIKRISEETDIKEEAIYDLIRGEIQKNVNKTDNLNIVENFGQKLYVDPIYLKAERNILRLIHEQRETWEYFNEHYNENIFTLESHKKIFKLISENIDSDVNQRKKHIELKCDDVDSSKEWLDIIELDLLNENGDYIKFIEDCIKEIKKFKLEETKKDILRRIKQHESRGEMQDSLKLTQQLMNIEQEITRL